MADSLDRVTLPISAYQSQHMSAGSNAENLEISVAAWLATKPGTFTSRDACGLYERALAKFEAWSDRPNGCGARDDFEVALARLGYRAGVVVYDGEPRWLLILPSSVDTALTRLSEVETRPA